MHLAQTSPFVLVNCDSMDVYTHTKSQKKSARTRYRADVIFLAQKINHAITCMEREHTLNREAISVIINKLERTILFVCAGCLLQYASTSTFTEVLLHVGILATELGKPLRPNYPHCSRKIRAATTVLVCCAYQVLEAALKLVPMDDDLKFGLMHSQRALRYRHRQDIDRIYHGFLIKKQ
jgi:hypothetical protein